MSTVWKCRDPLCEKAFLANAEKPVNDVCCPQCGGDNIHAEHTRSSQVSDMTGRGFLLDLGFGLLLEAQVQS